MDENADKPVKSVEISVIPYLSEIPVVPYPSQLFSSSRGPTKANAGLTWWQVALMQATFNTAGAVVTFPYACGVFGAFLGPCLLLAWMAIALYANIFIAASARRCSAKTLGDVGQDLAGRAGRIAATGLQMLNLIFLLPALLELMGDSFTYLVSLNNKQLSWVSCLGVWIIVTWIIVVVGLQFIRKFDTSIWFTYISFAMVIIKAFVVFPVLFASSNNHVQDSSPAQLAGAPVPLSWESISWAMSIFPYSVTPVFILVENMSEMQEPADIEKALYCAFSAMFIIYTVPGVVGVSLWGWNIANPVTNGLEVGAAAITANLFLLWASINDYIISTITLAKETQARLMPAFDITKWTPAEVGRWMLLTVPYSIFAVVIATCVPSFGTLVGLLTSLTIVLENTSVPAWFMLMVRRERGSETTDALVDCTDSVRWCVTATVEMAMLIGGVLLAAYLLAGSVAGLRGLEYSDFHSMFCGYGH